MYCVIGTFVRIIYIRLQGKITMCCEKKFINTKEEYYDLFAETAADTHLSKIKSALEKAHDIRKFEIDKYWQRTAYFWAFIVSVYVAYYHVFKEIYDKEHGSIPLVVLSALALFFSFSWYLSSKGSRKWQKSWEKHVDLLEDKITGPLYKTFLKETSPSVNKINEAAGFVMTLCSGLLCFIELLAHSGLLVAIISSCVIALLLCFYFKFTIGNTETIEEVYFEQRVYHD